MVYSSDLCVGGTPISGTLTWSHLGALSNAFDNDLGTRCFSDDGATTDGISWIGYDFSAAESYEIRRFGLSQHATANGMTSVEIDYSDNGTDWTTVDTIAVTKQVSPMLYYDVIASSSHRYWRLMANSNAGDADGWGVYEIEMMEIIGAAPTSVFYGPLIGPFGGPI